MADGSFVDRAWDAQHKLEKKMGAISKGRYARVLKMARKPEPDEFRRSALIVLVGIAVIGFIGFLVYLLMDWVQKAIV